MRKLDDAPRGLGERLRALRRAKMISLEEIERVTHIQRSYLIALEAGQYEKLPAPLYTRNFVRAYAAALKVDEDYFVDLYNEECGRCDLVDPMRMPRQRLRRIRLFVWNRLVKFTAAAGVLLVVFGYFSWQVRTLVQPPDVHLFSPTDEFMTVEAVVIVEGMVEKESVVYVNGEQVIVYDDHTFKADVDLQKGLNLIVIEAERRYSRKTLIERRVLYDPEAFSFRDK